MSAWFCWEKDFALRWTAVVYHDEKPKTKKGMEYMRSPVYEVPPECLSPDGSPMFGALAARFPPPKDKEED